MCYMTYLTFCFSEDLLKVEGMDMKVSEPITAAHLINAAKLGNSKADAVLNRGQITSKHTDMFCLRILSWLFSD